MENHSINDFVEIIARLRSPDGGCPWDLKQTYETMIPCLLEESYEVVDAIKQKSAVSLREELGDLLLQVVFLSQLASEEKKFTFNDVLNEVYEKIIRRHPHVFGNSSAKNEQEALQNWNQIKSMENKDKGHRSVLDNVPKAFPALLRAEKLQKKCSKVGFDWNELNQVFAKVEEELQEVKQEINRPHLIKNKIEEEIGDLLFAVTNLSRHLKCNTEEALRKANDKFERRFRAVEQKLADQNKSPADVSLTEMDMLWDEVKKEENG